MKKYRFKGEIVQHGNMDAGYVIFPFDVKKEFGAARVKIKATFDGVPYRGSLVPMGIKEGCPLLVLKEIRKAINKTFGDVVSVVLEKDTEERIVEIPADLAKVFSRKKKLKDAFENMAYTHKKEYVNYITDAKKPETRLRRIEKVLTAIEEYSESKEKKKK